MTCSYPCRKNDSGPHGKLYFRLALYFDVTFIDVHQTVIYPLKSVKSSKIRKYQFYTGTLSKTIGLRLRIELKCTKCATNCDTRAHWNLPCLLNSKDCHLLECYQSKLPLHNFKQPNKRMSIARLESNSVKRRRRKQKKGEAQVFITM